MNLLHELRAVLMTGKVVLPDERILVAVSGGTDSMVLLHLLQKLHLQMEVAHVNFGLRGASSDAEEFLVQQYCTQENLLLHTIKFDTTLHAESRKISIQMAARELRYNWFNELCGARNIQLIATAHHADDQAETILLKLIRGSGPAGLGGMQLRQGNLLRPLLHFTKSQLREWAEIHMLPWREDESNLLSDYQRNYLRNEILPLLHTLNPSLKETMAHFAGLMQSQQKLIRHQLEQLHCTHANPATGFIHIDINQLIEIPGYELLLYELLLPYKFLPSAIENLCRALNKPGKQFQTPTHRITTGRGEIIISPVNIPGTTEILIDKIPFRLNTPWGLFQATEEPLPLHGPSTDPHIIYADARKIRFPLMLRTWKEGDIFQPSGMKGRKKLSDFFIDRKISLPEKKHIPLLFSGDELVWICNLRMDERFVLQPDSTRIIRFTFLPGVTAGESVAG